MKKLIIIAGPSGVGKTTISRYLTQKYNIPRVITHTTRPLRSGEQDGVDYYFESADSFRQLHFFEHVKYGSYQYGSSRESLQKSFEKSDIVSLIVETAGVRTYLQELPAEAVFVYLTVSEPAELAQRLEERGDTKSQIEKRLHSPEFKRDLALDDDLLQRAHIIKNDSLDAAKAAVDQLIESLTNV